MRLLSNKANSRKKWIAWLLLLTLNLTGLVNASSMKLESNQVVSQGNSLILKGHVILDHPFGKISANQASIVADELNQKHFSTCLLKENVKIESMFGCKLACENALIDYVNFYGFFTGSWHNPTIYFSHSLRKKEEVGDLFEIRSNQLEVWLNPSDKDHFFKDLPIKQVKFSENVNVHYETKSLKKNTGPHQWLISAKSLIWNAEQKELQFLGGVHIKSSGFELKTESELYVFYEEHANEIILKSIFVPEKAVIVLLIDKKNEDLQEVYIPGALTVDHLNGKINGKSSLVEQIVFKNKETHLTADKIEWSYNKEDIHLKECLSSSSIKLFGHVEGFRTLLPNFSGTTEKFRYHLTADEANYSSSLKEIMLKGSLQEPVLLIDEVNQVQMIAPLLKIYHEETNGKEKIEALGDVRFIIKENKSIVKNFSVGGN